VTPASSVTPAKAGSQPEPVPGRWPKGQHYPSKKGQLYPSKKGQLYQSK